MKTWFGIAAMILALMSLWMLPAPPPGSAAPADGPGPRFGHSMVTINGNVYLFGGMEKGNPNPKDDLWEYHSASSTWSEVFAQGPAPAGRHSHTATVVNGKMYIYGGMDAMHQPLSDGWEYDAEANNWSEVLAQGPAPPARGYHTAAAVGDKLVVFGGTVSGGSPSSETWVYDTVASSWTQGQDFPDVGYADSAASYNGQVYVLGHTQGRLYVYDVTQDNWTTVEVGGANGTPSARVLAMSAQDADTAWLLGGEDVMTAETLGDAWSLDLATQTWTPAADLPEPLRHAAAALLDGGGQGQMRVAASSTRLLIFGGLDAQGQVNEEQIIYDPDPYSYSHAHCHPCAHPCGRLWGAGEQVGTSGPSTTLRTSSVAGAGGAGCACRPHGCTGQEARKGLNQGIVQEQGKHESAAIVVSRAFVV